MKKIFVYLAIAALLGVSMLLIDSHTTLLRSNERRKLAGDLNVVEFCTEGVQNFINVKGVEQTALDAIIELIPGWYEYNLSCLDKECAQKDNDYQQNADKYTYWAYNCVYAHTNEEKSAQKAASAENDITKTITKTATIAAQDATTDSNTGASADAAIPAVPDFSKLGTVPSAQENPDAAKAEQEKQAQANKGTPATPVVATIGTAGAAGDGAGAADANVVPPTPKPKKAEPSFDSSYTPPTTNTQPTPDGAPAKVEKEAPPAGIKPKEETNTPKATKTDDKPAQPANNEQPKPANTGNSQNDQCDRLVDKGYGNLTPEEKAIADGASQLYEAIGFNVKAGVDDKNRQKAALLEILTYIKQKTDGGKIDLFVKVVDCKINLLFPPVVDTTATTAAGAAGTSKVVGKCEGEFNKQFKGYILDLGIKYLDCAKNCAVTDEACSKECIPNGASEVEIHLHNCRFNKVPKIQVPQTEGGAQQKPVTTATNAGGKTTDTTATTTKAETNFVIPDETPECFKIRLDINSNLGDKELQENFENFLSCILKKPLGECATFNTFDQIRKYYECLKMARFPPVANNSTSTATGSTGNTGTNTGTGTNTPVASSENAACRGIVDKIFSSIENVIYQNDFINLFNCLSVCAPSEDTCRDLCLKGVKTDLVQNYVVCKASSDKLSSVIPGACADLWKTFSTASLVQIMNYGKCISPATVASASALDETTNEIKSDYLNSCKEAVVDPNAKKYFTCVSEAQRKPPVQQPAPGTAVWDLSRACEPIRVLNIPECRTLLANVKDLAKLELTFFFELSKYCNEVNDLGCLDEIQKKYIAAQASTDYINCARKFMPVPVLAHQACMDFQNQVMSDNFINYARQYRSNVLTNCPAPNVNDPTASETAFACFQTQIPEGAANFPPLADFNRCINEFNMASQNCNKPEVPAVPCQLEQDIATAKQPDEFKALMLCVTPCVDQTCFKSCLGAAPSVEVLNYYNCRSKLGSTTTGGTTSGGNPVCDPIKAGLPTVALTALTNFFNCNQACPPDATGRADQTCLNNCRQAVTEQGANDYLNCLVPPPQPCEYDFNQAVIENETSKKIVTNFRDAVKVCETKTSRADIDACVKVAFTFATSQSTSAQVLKFLNCRVNPPTAGGECQTLENAARKVDDTFVNNFYNDMKNCVAILNGNPDRETCFFKLNENSQKTILDPIAKVEIVAFLKCVQKPRAPDCSFVQPIVEQESPEALKRLFDQLNQCDLLDEISRKDCNFNAQVAFFTASKSQSSIDFIECRFRRPAPYCQPQFDAAVTENSPANGAANLKNGINKCLLAVETEKGKCFNLLITSTMTNNPGPKLMQFIKCQFPNQDCSTRHAVSASVNADATKAFTDSFFGCANLADEASIATCRDNARTNAFLGTPAAELVNFVLCVAPKQSTPPPAVGTGPCATFETAANTEDAAKLKSYNDALGACNTKADPIQQRDCIQTATDAAAATAGAKLKDLIQCRQPCGDIFLAAKTEDATQADTIKTDLTACFDPTQTDAERKTCFDATATKHKAETGKLAEYLNCRLPPPPAGPCDSWMKTAMTQDAATFKTYNDKVILCNAQTTGEAQETCVNAAIADLVINNPTKVEIMKFLQCHQRCGLLFLGAIIADETTTKAIKAAADVCSDTSVTAEPAACFDKVKTDFTPLAVKPIVNDYLKCRLPLGPCGNEFDAALKEDKVKFTSWETNAKPCFLKLDPAERRKCFNDANNLSQSTAGPALKNLFVCTYVCGRDYIDAKTMEDPVQADGIRNESEVCWGPNTLIANRPTCFTTLTNKYPNLTPKLKAFLTCVLPAAGTGGGTTAAASPCQAEFDKLDDAGQNLSTTFQSDAAKCTTGDIAACRKAAKTTAGGKTNVINPHLSCKLCKIQNEAMTAQTDKDAVAQFYTDVQACTGTDAEITTCVDALKTTALANLSLPFKNTINCISTSTPAPSGNVDPCQAKFDTLDLAQQTVVKTFNDAVALCTDDPCKITAKTNAGGAIKLINPYLQCKLCDTQFKAITTTVETASVNKFNQDVGACLANPPTSVTCIANLQNSITTSGSAAVQTYIGCITV